MHRVGQGFGKRSLSFGKETTFSLFQSQLNGRILEPMVRRLSGIRVVPLMEFNCFVVLDDVWEFIAWNPSVIFHCLDPGNLDTIDFHLFHSHNIRFALFWLFYILFDI